MSNATQKQKAQQRREKFAQLLREMFQLDQPELDFGLYRIMHARKDDINRFIDQDLPRITQEAFSQFASQDKTQLKAELEKARKAAEAAGFDPEASPKVKELKAQLKEGFDLAREEGEVYDALVTFFSRYYSEGDFLSRRVYKDGTYAIPYQGEEVVLHWANKDQYYIKSSETLRDYTFRLNPDAGPGEDPMRVHFKLVDAEAGAKDNNKESDESRRVFVLDAEHPFDLIDGEPDEQGNTWQELQCRFVFRPATEADWTEAEKKKATAAAQKKAPTQDALRTIACERLLGGGGGLPEEWKAPLSRPYKKADGEKAEYSILAGQLNNYTKKNTFDYFIHKDLGGFLNRELDFYIKNEILDWNDISALKNEPSRLAPLLSKVEVIRSLGEKIIAFLAQLEDFQKKLWTKKKFVTEAHYCITIDHIKDHKDLLEEIFSCDKQLKAWEVLYKVEIRKMLKEKDDLTWEKFLEIPRYRYMMVDTSQFNNSFKHRLLSKINDLDRKCDGLLVSSENFQALNLLKEKYKERVDCAYIDPPYNTNASSILYKNGYKDSSWLSLMADRLRLGAHLLTETAIVCVAIDDVEMPYLKTILNYLFPKQVGVSVVRSNPQSRKTKGKFSPVHEYALFYGKSEYSSPGSIGANEEKKARYPLVDEKGRYAWMNFIRAGTNDLRSDRPKSFYPIVVSKDNKIRIPSMRWNEEKGCYDLLEEISGDEVLVWPIKHVDGKPVEKRWQRGHKRVESELTEYRARRSESGSISIDFKTRMDEGAAPTTWWDNKAYASSNYGTAELQAVLGEARFDFPKSVELVKDCLLSSGMSGDNTSVIDFFAGSGTTGEAVIRLNRENGGRRKFILCEMGEYFAEVLKPRIIRSLYSGDWEFGGLPADPKVSSESQCIKVIRLEAYEDTISNLSLGRSETQESLLKSNPKNEKNEPHESYILNYMLATETRGSQSLLNTKKFVDPESYSLSVRSAHGNEASSINVDLVETFNYLLGLDVEYMAEPLRFDAKINQGEFGRWEAKVKRSATGKWWFRSVYGVSPSGQKVLVVWRNMPCLADHIEEGISIDNAVLDAVLVEKLNIRLTESRDDEIDVLYVNGDHNIAIPRNRRGEPMEQARIQLIEEAFHRLMFADTETVQ